MTADADRQELADKIGHRLSDIAFFCERTDPVDGASIEEYIAEVKRLTLRSVREAQTHLAALRETSPSRSKIGAVALADAIFCEGYGPGHSCEDGCKCEVHFEAVLRLDIPRRGEPAPSNWLQSEPDKYGNRETIRERRPSDGEPAPERQPAAPVPLCSEWMDIETAPKDGTHILVCNGPYRDGLNFNQSPPCVVHYWSNPGEEGFYLSRGIVDGSYNDKPVNFTHWQPLSAPPGEPAPDSGCKNKGGTCGCLKYCAESTAGVRVKENEPAPERQPAVTEEEIAVIIQNACADLRVTKDAEIDCVGSVSFSAARRILALLQSPASRKEA